MNKRIFVVITLLLLLALTGCSLSVFDRTGQAPGEASRASTSAAAKDEKISFLQALSISLKEYRDEDGAFGMETIRYRARTMNREIDLLFADRTYTLTFSGDLSTEKGSWHVVRHTDGQYWNTQDDITPPTPKANVKSLYAVADIEEIVRQQDVLIFHLNNLYNAFFYQYYLLKDYDRYIEDAPEKTDFNGIPCWRYTLVREYDSSLVPAGSKEHSLFYFRQDNWHFVYEKTDIITPDGAVIPDQEMRTLSGKEASDFYRTKAGLFTDVDYRDAHGEHTLTVVIDPGEAGEITYRCPINSDELVLSYFPDPARRLYLDRAGTVRAESEQIVRSGTDMTVYAIKNERTTSPSESVPPQTSEADSLGTENPWADTYNGLPLLERNDQDTISETELCNAIYSGGLSVIEPWMNRGAIDYSKETIADAGAAVFAWAQEVKKHGFIDDCTLCEESGTVAFFLKSGGINLFSLPIRQTYSGDQYVAVGIEGLSFIDDAVISVLDQYRWGWLSVTGAREASAYIDNTIENYTHNNISAGELTVDSLIAFLERIPEQHIRVIFWRSHGDLFEGLDRQNHLALCIQDKENDEKKERYKDDIDEKRILHHNGNYYAVSDYFFDKYLPEVDGGLFCCGACYSGADGGKTAQIFFEKGFDCYIGPSDAVWTTYSDKMLGQIAVHLCQQENNVFLTASEALERAKKDVGEHDIYGTYFAIGENSQKEPFRLVPSLKENNPEQSSTEPDISDEPSIPETEPVSAPPAFTAENIAPYTRMVTDLAYAVLQRGTAQSLSGSVVLRQSKAAVCFKLDELHAMFEYCYRNEDLLLDPVFGGTYDAANAVRYCQADQDKIIRTLKALLNLEVGREGYPASYDRSQSPLCIWNQNGLYLCLPMMGEAPGAVCTDLVLSEEKALLYADVFEPFNDVPTDRLVVTLIPAENELGFTIESISLNPESADTPAGRHDLENGTYDLWYNFIDLPMHNNERDYDAFAVNYTEGVEVKVTLKSSGKYIRLTKDFLETTFSLHGIIGAEHIYTPAGELVRIPVSSAIQNDIANRLEIMKWIFTEGAFELFTFAVEDGVMIWFTTVS